MIREARGSDRDPLEALYRELLPDKKNLNVMASVLEEIYNDPHNFIFVYEEKGQVAATVGVSICREAINGSRPFGVVENIVVAESQRSKGIGNMMLDYVDSFCLRKECSKIMLLSNAKRLKAHAFFERQGYSGSMSRGFKKYI